MQVLIQAEADGRVLLLPIGEPCTLGRVAEQSRFVLRDPTISRVHCQLTADPDGSVRVQDLGSTAGTWIDQRRLEGEARVAPGTQFRAGQAQLKVLGLIPPFDPARRGEPIPPVWLDPEHLLLREVGRGGMGVVYEAWRTSGKEQRCAVKWLRRLPIPEEDREVMARFQREVRLQASLGDYPGVVKVLDVREVPGTGEQFCVQELVGGRSLREALHDGMLRLEAVRIVARLARAVGYAHQKGVIHRDLKPANVLLTREGALRLTDFGIAKALLPAMGQGPLTQVGILLGTPGYMSPEQIQGAKDVGPKSDVYGVGAILYEVLTGKLPCRGKKISEAIHSVMRGDYDPPRTLDQSVDPELDAICRDALALKPDGRPTPDQLAERLEAWLLKENPKPRVSLKPPSDLGRIT